MDLSILQRSLNKENIDSETQSLVRPKLSFSVASLLASAARSNSPRTNVTEESHEDDDEIAGDESDVESDVSVDSHGDDDTGAALYNSRLNDSSDVDPDQDLSASSPTRYVNISLISTILQSKIDILTFLSMFSALSKIIENYF